MRCAVYARALQQEYRAQKKVKQKCRWAPRCGLWQSWRRQQRQCDATTAKTKAKAQLQLHRRHSRRFFIISLIWDPKQYWNRLQFAAIFTSFISLHFFLLSVRWKSQPNDPNVTRLICRLLRLRMEAVSTVWAKWRLKFHIKYIYLYIYVGKFDLNEIARVLQVNKFANGWRCLWIEWHNK